MSYFVPWVNGKIRQDSVCNLIIVDGYHRSGGMAIMVSSQQWRMVDKMDLKGLHIGVKWCGQDARPELWPLGIAAQLGQHFGVLLQHIFGHGQRFLYIRKYIIVNSGVNGFKFNVQVAGLKPEWWERRGFRPFSAASNRSFACGLVADSRPCSWTHRPLLERRRIRPHRPLSPRWAPAARSGARCSSSTSEMTNQQLIICQFRFRLHSKKKSTRANESIF